LQESAILEKLRSRVVEQLPSISTQRRFFVIAATLDKRGRIISIGENYMKTHPLMDHYSNLLHIPHKKYLHAEVSALINSNNVQPHSIVVVRVNKEGGVCLAKPCPICERAIADFKVVKTYYSTDGGELKLL